MRVCVLEINVCLECVASKLQHEKLENFHGISMIQAEKSCFFSKFVSHLCGAKLN